MCLCVYSNPCGFINDAPHRAHYFKLETQAAGSGQLYKLYSLAGSPIRRLASRPVELLGISVTSDALGGRVGAPSYVSARRFALTRGASHARTHAPERCLCVLVGGFECVCVCVRTSCEG